MIEKMKIESIKHSKEKDKETQKGGDKKKKRPGNASSSF